MFRLLVSVLLVALVAPSWTLYAEEHSQDERAIREVVSSFNEARNASDIKRLISLFTEDGETFGNPGKPRKGPAELETVFNHAKQVAQGSRATRTVTNIRFVKPDVAVVTIVGEATGAVQWHFLEVDVMVKQNGAWRITSHHNIHLPEPTIPAHAK